jgi:putative zinc finger/helix-turn-helix YgiT family protein
MHCRERAVSPTTIPSYQRDVEHDGRSYAIAVEQLRVLQCGNCGEIVLDDAANRRISDALRTAAGLMLSEEIRQRREALGLLQKQVASALQISESTLSRWETGAQIQQRCMDRFLRAFFDLEALRGYLSTPEAAWVEPVAQVAGKPAQE